MSPPSGRNELFLSRSIRGGSFAAGFLSSLVSILCSELGDKTFIIAALLSMKHNHLVVFTGSMCALTLMTIMSALAGYVLPALLSPIYTHFAAVILFFIFGIRLIIEGTFMDKNAGLEEVQQVEAELMKKTDMTCEVDQVTECVTVETMSPHDSAASGESSPVRRLAEVLYDVNVDRNVGVGGTTHCEMSPVAHTSTAIAGSGGGKEIEETQQVVGTGGETGEESQVIMRTKSDRRLNTLGKETVTAKIRFWRHVFSPVFIQVYIYTNPSNLIYVHKYQVDICIWWCIHTFDLYI